MDDLVAAASAALGQELADPQYLEGSESSVVARCRRLDRDGTVIVKRYPRTAAGTGRFAAEAAGLAFAWPARAGPRLFATSLADLVLVMSDLGSAPTLADVLLAGPRANAQAALLGWARACGRLAVRCCGREREFSALLAAYRGLPVPDDVPRRADRDGHWLERRISAVPALLVGLDVAVPAGLDRDLAEIVTILRAPDYEVFSPGDICPDNNVLTMAGVRFVDFESAEYHSAFLDAAYLRMPFSTCWCVFRLPDELAESAEAAYRNQVAEVYADLADDRVWLPGVRRAVAAWTLHATAHHLAGAVAADRPMTDDSRAAPTVRQLLRYRWRCLVGELGPSGELPALGELAGRLLHLTRGWQVPDLPAYPGLR